MYCTHIVIVQSHIGENIFKTTKYEAQIDTIILFHKTLLINFSFDTNLKFHKNKFIEAKKNFSYNQIRNFQTQT